MMRTRKFLIATLAVAGGGLLQSQQAKADEGGDWQMHGFADVSLKNDYVTPRGLVVTTKGATVQILNGLVLVSPGGVAFHAGTWTDLNPGYGDVNTNSLNEFDFFFGASAPIAKGLTAGVEYSQFISGQNAFRDEKNLEFSVKYADNPDGKFAFNPYAKFFWAMAGDSTVVLGKQGDTFDIELGAVPTLKLKGVTLSAPTWITVGPESYWSASPLTRDGNFGVFSTGLKASVPVKFIKGPVGVSAYAQVQYYNLINDNLVAAKALLNGGADNRSHVVVAAGLNFGF